MLRTTGTVFCLPYPAPQSWALGNPLLSFRNGLPILGIRTRWPIMLCGLRWRGTSTGSPAQNKKPSFWPALPSPSELGLREFRIVDQNRITHHAARSGWTLHLHREPCLEQQAPFLPAVPSLLQLGPRDPPIVRIELHIMLCGRCRRSTATGSLALNRKPPFWAALPSH